MVEEMVDTVLSGMRPTGRLHVGHVVGALDNWVEMQNRGDKTFYFVADWHAITTQTDTRDIKSDSIEMAKDWLAAGVDPNKSTLFIQSQVPQHAELNLILERLINVTLPRIRDFKGVNDRLDGSGNYTLGIQEHIIFPEIDYDKIDKIKGMNITIVTTAKNNTEGKELLKLIGMPFKN